MVTYTQKMSWIEDGKGKVYAYFVVSDVYDGLFIPFANGIQTSIFEISDVTRKSSTKAGGLIENDLSFEIKESQTMALIDDQARLFVIEAVVTKATRYVGLFVDPAGISPDIENDTMFYGFVQYEAESDDFKWHNEYYSEARTPKSNWKFKARPYQENLLSEVTMNDLTQGNSSKQIPGIWTNASGVEDLTWENANVESKQGYYANSSDGIYVKVSKLTDLNLLVRKITDNLEIALVNNGYGAINITFEGGFLDYKLHPARWFRDYISVLGRHESEILPSDYYYLSQSGWTFVPSYKVYSDDYIQLKFDPDNTIPDANKIWVSYSLVKPSNSEPRPESAKNYMFSKVSDYFTFIRLLALNLGCYADFIWYSATDLKIKFIARKDFIQSKSYIRTALKSSTKYSAKELDAKVTYAGYSNYLAVEGNDIYTILRMDSVAGYQQSDKMVSSQKTDAQQLLLTISPTMVVDLHGMIPHNHYRTIVNAGTLAHYGIHTAIYLKVNKNVAHDSSTKQPNEYWTPAAKITVNIDGEDREFEGFAEYLNEVDKIDTRYLYLEKQIEVPGLSGFSHNADGSNPRWNCIDIGSEITLDGINYVVNEIKRSFKTLTTNLTLSLSDRYSYHPTTVKPIEEYDKKAGMNGALIALMTSSNFSVHIASGDIQAMQVVSLKADGTVEKSDSIASHHGRIYGFALNNALNGENVRVQRCGTLRTPDEWVDVTPNTYLFLRHTENVLNYSDQPLTNYNEIEDLYCVLGRFISTREIEIFENFPDTYTFYRENYA